MKWASVIAKPRRLDDAVEQACEDLSAALDGETPSVIFAFASGQYATHFERLPQLIDERLPGALLLGCSAPRTWLAFQTGTGSVDKSGIELNHFLCKNVNPSGNKCRFLFQENLGIL